MARRLPPFGAAGVADGVATAATGAAAAATGDGTEDDDLAAAEGELMDPVTFFSFQTGRCATS